MTTPSLVMIPSGYKSEKVYSVLPSNGDGDFTFDRDSNATRVNKDGLIEEVSIDVPRLDYSDGSCPSLLLENQSTNLIPYSSDFSQSSWSSFNGTIVVPNQITSPDGSLLADRIECGIDGALTPIFDYINITNGEYYTFSVFAKKGEIDKIIISGQEDLLANTLFNLTTGTVISTSGSGYVSSTIEEFSNGWYRCSVTALASGTRLGRFILYAGITGDEPDLGDGIYYFGAQQENQSYSTSYIPTNGATATRVAETCTDAGNSDTFNSEEGALFYEALFGEEHSDSRYISISDSSSSNRVIIGVTGGSNVLRAFVFSGGVEQAQIIETIDLSQTIKVCISYKQNEIKFYKNGFLVGEDTSAITPVGLSELSFNAYPSSANFYGKAKEVRVYSEALTDTELQELTS